MQKKMLFAAALIAGLIPIAVAQDSRLPQASLDREVNLPLPAQATVPGNPPHQIPGPPSYCKPCLFYAGDFDSTASDANGLANEFDIIVSTGAAVYAPFIVPKGKTWTVTGLFTNNFLSGGVLDPVISPYEIRKGIPTAGGNGGTLVCHGRKPATLIPGVRRVLPLSITQPRSSTSRVAAYPPASTGCQSYLTARTPTRASAPTIVASRPTMMARWLTGTDRWNRRTTRSSTRFSSARFGSRARSNSPVPVSPMAWKEHRSGRVVLDGFGTRVT